MITKLKVFRLSCDGYLRNRDGLAFEPCQNRMEATAADKAEAWEKAVKMGWTALYDGSHYCGAVEHT